MNQNNPILLPAFPSHTTIKSVGIIGAGLMGQSIAKVHLQNNFDVYLAETNLKVLSNAVKQLAPFINGQNKLHPINQQEEWNGFRNCDLVIEAVSEKLKIKSDVLKTAEHFLNKSAILTTNTSSIPLETLANKLEHPEIFAAFHFCHPIENRDLIEIVGNDKSDANQIQRLITHARQLKKKPLSLKNSPGFVVNRLLAFYMNETMELILDGVSFEKIEQAARDFGMPMGPLNQLDSLGIDIAVRVGQNLFWNYPSRMNPSELLVRMYKSDLHGRKTGEGFYQYNEAGEITGRSHKTEILITERLRENQEYSIEDIQNRLFLPWVVEGSILLEENVIHDPEIIDQALTYGLGFQHSTGGILNWADQIGINEIINRLRIFESLGQRYQPTPYLLNLAKQHKGFLHSIKAGRTAA